VGLRARATSQTPVTMSPAPPTRRIALCLQHAFMLTCSASEAEPGSPGNMMNTARPQEVELTHRKCPRNGFDASSKDVLEGSTLLSESAGGVQWAFRWRREER